MPIVRVYRLILSGPLSNQRTLGWFRKRLELFAASRSFFKTHARQSPQAKVGAIRDNVFARSNNKPRFPMRRIEAEATAVICLSNARDRDPSFSLCSRRRGCGARVPDAKVDNIT